MKDRYNIKGIDFETDIVFYFDAHGEKHSIRKKPGEVDDFLKDGIDDVDKFLCERFLMRRNFVKGEDGRWNYNKIPEKEAKLIELPHYFFRNGGFVVQFGTVGMTLSLINGTINHTEDLPLKVLPVKIEKNFYIKGNLITNYTTTYDEWYKKAIELPYYEHLEEKINRWVNGEFEILSVQKYKISYLNWYINKHPESGEKLYEWFEPKFDRLIDDEEHLHGEIKVSKWPKGFFEWLIDRKDYDIKNLLKSVIGISKFAI